MFVQLKDSPRKFFVVVLSLLLLVSPLTSVNAQDPVTGAFSGTVSDSRTLTPITNARVTFINQVTQVPLTRRTNGQGQFFQALLQPGAYTIQVQAQGYKSKEFQQRLVATQTRTVVPLPITLDPDVTLPEATPPATRPQGVDMTITKPPVPPAPPAAGIGPITESVEVTAELNATDARRSGAFTEAEVASLPLGSSTFTRSFDELALLLPGVALPPQTQGGVAGPGVGPGVGSAGQFAISGLRSRGNNFTVDGSDNNDEDIGVRRQGFFTLVPQPIESVKEYQVITTLAPAQFGRNLGAYVNAISKSGGAQTHGTFYGFFNASQLNSRDFFDTTSTGAPQPLTGITTSGVVRNVFLANSDGSGRQQIMVSNPAAGQDSRTFGQVGFVLGGPLLATAPAGVAQPKSAFYFFSFEGQLLNANQEKSFAVPTVEERGLNRSGATGLVSGNVGGFPTNLQGDALFSLFPLPNNAAGIYGRHTFTQILPASAQGNVASLKFDYNFPAWARQHALTGRYNRTQDWRNLPATGGGLFASLRPVVRTNNFSLFLNSELSGAGAMTPIFNQFRASYGRTQLRFEEERDAFLLPSRVPNEPFLLNAPLVENYTLPSSTFVDYRRAANFDVERSGGIGPVGQVLIAGYSPLGADVFSFPQRRANNTYQLADILSLRVREHSYSFGGEFRRTQLNSNLPRNARPLITFGSRYAVDFDQNARVAIDAATNSFVFNRILSPTNAAAAAAPANMAQALVRPGKTANIGLRYNQINLFAQDELRLRPDLSLSYGLRYEYNTPPREVDGLIEQTFKDPDLGLVPGLQQFLQGREQIFDPDRNNFAPRLGLAFARNFFGTNSTVFRVGYGIYHDQVLGAVVSQSRNVFPNFSTINTGGGLGAIRGRNGQIGQFGVFNTALSTGPNSGNGIRFTDGRFFPFVAFGTLNRLNEPNIPLSDLVRVLVREFPGEFGFTLPARKLPSPFAHQYSFTIEQQLNTDWVASAAYVGTLGRKLLRLTTPNLGPNLILAEGYFCLAPIPNDPGICPGQTATGTPFVYGYRLTPGQRLRPANANNLVYQLRPDSSRPGEGRPVSDAGTIFLYETNAESRYDSLQLQLRGRYRHRLLMQASYTLSHALDDVSDVFDLAGAPALPQNSLAPDERASANFDVRQRFVTSFGYVFPTLSNRSRAANVLLGGFELAGTLQYQTGQPFTVNSIFDINLDGNYTDRLNTTAGLTIARGNNRHPVQLQADNENPNATRQFRALFGQHGAVGRNTFRAGDYFLANLALVKNFAIREQQRVTFRVEAFNVADYANFGIPVRFLESFAFGQATETVTPGRRVQFALKYSF